MIDVSKLDKDFKYEVMKEPGGEKLTRCFACGTCVASCVIRSVDDRFDPRKIIRMAVLGMKEQVLSSDFIWFCTSCYTCTERCPQDVLVTGVMNALKNIAVREGFIHRSYIAQIAALFNYGSLYEVDDFTNRRREKRGLPPLAYDILRAKKLLSMTDVYQRVKDK
jgi:heterodisulfide reductase subunit C